MKIPTKQEYFKKLRSNQEYQSLLKKIPDIEERKRAIYTIEYIMENFINAFSVIGSTAAQSPEAAEKIMEALKTGDGIIKESDGEPIMTKEK